jgi:cytochrome c biogenesis protein CcmG/thiol:disulfide interchange protein DsbE
MPRRNKHLKKKNFDPVLIISTGVFLVTLAVLLFLIHPSRGSVSQSAVDQLSVEPAAVNYPAPELSLQNVSGKSESLADFREQIVLVNNWAVWCPPCKAELPTLESYYEAHAADGFMIIGIEAGEPQNVVSQFVQIFGLKFHVWLDPKNASLAAFRNGSLPNSYVIDRKGAIRYAWTGEINRAMLEKYITPLLSQ